MKFINGYNDSMCKGGKLKVNEGRLRVTELVLRCVVCGMAILAVILVVSDTEERTFFTIPKRAKFTQMKTLVFLVTINGIAAFYSLFQALWSAMRMIRRSVLFNKPLAWAIFSFDQALAYVMFASVAASAQSGFFSEKGQPEFQWLKLCTMYGKFCTQAGGGLAGSCVVSVSMTILSCLSAFNLFRLYGDTKGKTFIKS